MAICPRCRQPTSIWNRGIVTQICPQCRRLDEPTLPRSILLGVVLAHQLAHWSELQTQCPEDCRLVQPYCRYLPVFYWAVECAQYLGP